MLVVVALRVIARVVVFSLLRGPVSSDELLVDVVIGAAGGGVGCRVAIEGGGGEGGGGRAVGTRGKGVPVGVVMRTGLLLWVGVECGSVPARHVREETHRRAHQPAP